MFDIKDMLTGMAPYVQFISCGLLVLSGLNLPISEDMVIIISASIAATVIPHNLFYIFAGCLLGAYMSDIVSYSIGRFGIKKLLYSPFLVRLKFIDPASLELKISTMTRYFNRYGGKTLFFGRFIPMGMRNVIFMTCGFIKMKVPKFLIIDFCAVTCTSFILFSLGYTFGNNYAVILPYLERYKYVVAGIVVCAIIFFFVRGRKRSKANIIAGNSNNKDSVITSKNASKKEMT